MNEGNLYLITLIGRRRNISERVKYICSAHNVNDVNQKVSYYAGLLEYDSYTVHAIDRIKPSFHIVERHAYQVETSEEKNQTVKQIKEKKESRESPTLQASNKKIYAFGFIGYIRGPSERNILLRLADFLTKKAIGGNPTMPFVSNGHYNLEAIGEVGNIKMAQLDKSDPYIFEGGRMIVGGGGCSPR